MRDAFGKACASVRSMAAPMLRSRSSFAILPAQPFILGAFPRDFFFEQADVLRPHHIFQPVDHFRED